MSSLEKGLTNLVGRYHSHPIHKDCQKMQKNFERDEKVFDGSIKSLSYWMKQSLIFKQNLQRQDCFSLWYSSHYHGKHYNYICP